MIGLGLAWLFLTGLGALLTQVSLKKTDLTAKQRKSGVVLGLINIGFLLILGLIAYLSSWDAKHYSAPAITKLSDLPEARGAIARGVVGETLAEEEKGYAIYAFYTGTHRAERVFEHKGTDTLKVILQDGSSMTFDYLGNPPADWNWTDQGDYRFLKPGDEVWVKARFTPREGKTLSAETVEFIFRGSESDFQGSLLMKVGKAAGHIHLALAVLSCLSAFGVAVFLALRGKTPQASPAPE